MKPLVLVHHEFAVQAPTYTVRALLVLEGRPPSQCERVRLNLAVVLDRSGFD